MFIVLGVLWILECIHFFNHSNSCEKHGDMAPEIFFRLVTDRVSSEPKLSRKNEKIFDRILQIFFCEILHFFRKMNYAKKCENGAKFHENSFREILRKIILRKKKFSKTIIVVAATINCAKILVEFFAQH